MGLRYFQGGFRNFQRGLIIFFRRGGGVIEIFSEEFHGGLRHC